MLIARFAVFITRGSFCNLRDPRSMIAVAKTRNQPESLSAVAEWFKDTYARIGSSNVNDILRQVGLDEHASRATWLRRRRKNN